MPSLKRIIDFYIISNIHVAVAGFCISKITLLKYGIHNNLVPFFVGFSIILSYNFIRFYEIKTNRMKWYRVWLNQNKKLLITLQVFSICSIVFILFFRTFDLKSIATLFPFGLMTFFYVVPVFKLNNKEFSFRYFPGLKTYSIAIAWAGVSVLFPLSESNVIIDFNVVLEFIQRFLFVLVITIPFDIRDMDSDAISLKTIPQVFGVSNTKKLGLVLLVIFVLISLYVNKYLIIDVLIATISGLFLWFSTSDRSRYYTGFWVESVPIIWLFLLLILN
ncbi:UbiA prenyltransferase family protein [Lutibacter citreus]|uniref:hypothetical protein n=1 Tax=Lutibacter citreus TaxID=2138210 RepID=UPI000DBE49D8|nr:hypothetical protein [Lutibacter citreus]